MKVYSHEFMYEKKMILVKVMKMYSHEFMYGKKMRIVYVWEKMRIVYKNVWEKNENSI